MPIDALIVQTMLVRIADFFRYMANNDKRRLYYVLPIDKTAPYAYQHSSIRDVATVYDILNLVKFFHERKLPLTSQTIELFKNLVRNTLQSYCNLYLKGGFANMPDSNIGDFGFLLLALTKCRSVFPTELPKNWEDARLLLTKTLVERQRADGSFRLFFDDSMVAYEQSGEPFYLPEALIGLIASLKATPDASVEEAVQRGVDYLCQDVNRVGHLGDETETFYANWQFQLLYHWMHLALEKGVDIPSLTINHLAKLVQAITESKIANMRFGSAVATVEVACYLEGLVHARESLKTLGHNISAQQRWLETEIERSISFLHEVQNEALSTIHGGFVHSLYSREARVDVAGHVFGGLIFLL